MYPSLLICLNVSRETKTHYVISIDNSDRIGKVDVNQVMPSGWYPEEMDLVINGLAPKREFVTYNVNDFFLGAIYTKENAVSVGSTYFNLPTYDEMSKLIDDKLSRAPSYSHTSA